MQLLPDTNHEFRLQQVPPGRRVLKAWHPRLQPLAKVIEVPASGTIRVDLKL